MSNQKTHTPKGSLVKVSDTEIKERTLDDLDSQTRNDALRSFYLLTASKYIEKSTRDELCINYIFYVLWAAPRNLRNNDCYYLDKFLGIYGYIATIETPVTGEGFTVRTFTLDKNGFEKSYSKEMKFFLCFLDTGDNNTFSIEAYLIRETDTEYEIKTKMKEKFDKTWQDSKLPIERD